MDLHLCIQTVDMKPEVSVRLKILSKARVVLCDIPWSCFVVGCAILESYHCFCLFIFFFS